MSAPMGLEILCSWCLRIRSSAGVWLGAEVNPTRDRFGHYSHGICPVCLERHFKELSRIVAASSAERAAGRSAMGIEDVPPRSGAGPGSALPGKERLGLERRDHDKA